MREATLPYEKKDLTKLSDEQLKEELAMVSRGLSEMNTLVVNRDKTAEIDYHREIMQAMGQRGVQSEEKVAYDRAMKAIKEEKGE